MSRRLVAIVLALAVVVAVAGGGITGWLLLRDHSPEHPEISAYSHGQLTRVGPFVYCNVLNLNDCETPQDQGELAVNDRDPVQLSLPMEISGAPWRLMQVYDDAKNPIVTTFRPDTGLAETIPTIDPKRGRLTGFTVQLLTLVVDENGELRDAPHAEWSVRTVWS